MATTVQSIFDQALGLSIRNRRDSISNEPQELTRTLQRSLVELFTDAATYYPEYFGARDAVPYSVPLAGWPRPSSALAIYRMELDPSGAELYVASDRDRQPDRFTPSVIERGRVFYPGATSNSPTAGSLIIYYARSPAILALNDLSQYVDTGLPDQYIPYLVYAIGMYLANKDQRMEELPALQAEQAKWRQLWQQHLQEATLNTRYRWAPRTVTAPGTRVTEERPT